MCRRLSPSLLSMWVALLSGASVVNQVKGPSQVIIKQEIKLNLVMKTLPDRENPFGELVPVIFQVAGLKKCFQNLLGNNFLSDGICLKRVLKSP